MAKKANPSPSFKKKNSGLPGSIFLNNGRYWWRVQLPGEEKLTPHPLKPTGARFATKDPGTAEQVALEMWQKAAFKTNHTIDDGTVTSLAQAYMEYARGYYRESGEHKSIKYATTVRLLIFDFLISL